MRDHAILAAAIFSFEALRLWHHWYLPHLILAAVALLERQEPELEPDRQQLTIGELTVADTRWGSATWPAVWVDLV